MGPISWGYIDMEVLLLLLLLMHLHSFCCPFSPSYHVFPVSTFAFIRQQSLVRMCSRRLNTGAPHDLACEADEERTVVHFGESSYIGQSRGHDRTVRGTISVPRGGARTRRSRNRRNIREAGIAACRQ